MTRQISYTRLEQALLPGFRERMDRAESTEEVGKFFSEVASTFLSDALGEPGAVRHDMVKLAPGESNGYVLSDDIRALPGFLEAWDGSDMPRILSQLAGKAVNRFVHLDKNPEKTEAKMFHNQGRR